MQLDIGNCTSGLSFGLRRVVIQTYTFRMHHVSGHCKRRAMPCLPSGYRTIQPSISSVASRTLWLLRWVRRMYARDDVVGTTMLKAWHGSQHRCCGTLLEILTEEVISRSSCCGGMLRLPVYKMSIVQPMFTATMTAYSKESNTRDHTPILWACNLIDSLSCITAFLWRWTANSCACDSTFGWHVR